MSGSPTDARRILRIRGTVQGVGFRPFVYRAAADLGLRGSVWNDPDGVVIEAEGAPAALDDLVRRIADAPPPQARIEAVHVEDAPAIGLGAFAIRESEDRAPVAARVS